MVMRGYRFASFGLGELELVELPEPEPGPGEVVVQVEAFSLNYRDLMVLEGVYNPKLPLPATPVSDGAGTIVAVGGGVEGLAVGDAVISHFIADWQDGPYRADYVSSTLGAPGPGLALERVALPAHAVLPRPAHLSPAQASTLPIAALTAWSGLIEEGGLTPDGSMLALGTGGVSIFGLQIAKALGARALITSSSDEKLERARQLGADGTVNYVAQPDWEKQVLALTDGAGVDVTLELGGGGTLPRSIKATGAGGTIAVIGVLAGVDTQLQTISFMMKRQKIQGILVDSKAAFARMNRFLEEHRIEPVIDARYPFEQLPRAFEHMRQGSHFGKLVVEIA
jgi:NADPH:quinone reductase-like Zn-dependent oxidoreductase